MTNNQSTFTQEFGYLIDQFDELQDLRWSDLQYLDEYRELKMKKNDGLPIDQNRLDELELIFKNKIVTSARWNKFQNALVGMQTFIKTEVEDFVNGMQDNVTGFVDYKKDEMDNYVDDAKDELQHNIDQFDNKKEYFPTKQYYKNNFVEFDDGSGTKTYIAVEDNKGKEPTDIDYWRMLTITGAKGEKGADAIGLRFKGTWDGEITYDENDGVQYGGVLFASLVDFNEGNEPNLSEDTEYWGKAIYSAITVRQLIGVRNLISETDTVNFITGEISGFNKNIDTLEVYQNSVRLTKDVDYVINDDNTTISKVNGNWDASSGNPIFFEFAVMKNVLNDLVFSDGSSIKDGTINRNKLTLDVQDEINKIDNLSTDVDTHKADYASFKNNIEAIRYVDEKMELKINGEWVEFKGKDGYPVGNVAGLSISVGNSEATIKWQDPDDVTIKDSLNNIITIARWKGTKLVRKAGSYPINEADGDLVLDNATRNKYQTNGYKDTGLTNGTTYYYMLFPYTEENVVTIDSANRISATPQAYDDLSGSPGPKDLIAGDMEEGFFGEVSTTALITGDALASECGISQGTSQHSTAGWLKFAYKGEIQFVAKKPIRHSISWNAINTAKCVYGDSGDKTVTIDGLTYKVRLMRALEPSNNPKTGVSSSSGTVNRRSEWNRLMCQIHEGAISKNWSVPNNIESDIGILEHSLGSGSQGMYNDADLWTHYHNGNGSRTWCQEMGTTSSRRIYRGYTGVSSSDSSNPSGTGTAQGWRPVLELV
ncbi:MAG TPA: hypothetical protein VFC79_04555 [Tissierellaceae bacterium]|nr:hypothetical protein [Tissierellaceae bacterium]